MLANYMNRSGECRTWWSGLEARQQREVRSLLDGRRDDIALSPRRQRRGWVLWDSHQNGGCQHGPRGQDQLGQHEQRGLRVRRGPRLHRPFGSHVPHLSSRSSSTSGLGGGAADARVRLFRRTLRLPDAPHRRCPSGRARGPSRRVTRHVHLFRDGFPLTTWCR